MIDNSYLKEEARIFCKKSEKKKEEKKSSLIDKSYLKKGDEIFLKDDSSFYSDNKVKFKKIKLG